MPQFVIDYVVVRVAGDERDRSVRRRCRRRHWRRVWSVPRQWRVRRGRVPPTTAPPPRGSPRGMAGTLRRAHTAGTPGTPRASRATSCSSATHTHRHRA